MEYIMNWYPSKGIENFNQSIDNRTMKRSLAQAGDNLPNYVKMLEK